MLNNIKDEGIILNVKDFRENDKKVDIILANDGIISAVAFGAKKSRKRFGGNLDPYNLADFEILSTKKGFYLKEVSIKKIFTNIKQNIQTLLILFNITKLLTSKPFNINKNIYNALLKLLIKLEDEKNDMTRYYLSFLIYFLKKEGLFSSTNCYICNSRDVHHLIFDQDSLLFVCKKCSNSKDNLTDEEIDFLKTCLNGDKRFKNKHYDISTLLKIELLLIGYINRHFYIILDKLQK